MEFSTPTASISVLMVQLFCYRSYENKVGADL